MSWRTGLFAGIDQADKKVIEILRLFTECTGKCATGLNVCFYLHDQLRHARIRMALSDDIKCLYQRYTGFEHGGHLPAEHGDISRFYLFTTVAK